MIIDLQKFVRSERPYWTELESMLQQMETDPGWRLDLAGAERFHSLYQRTSADLAKMMTFSAEPEIRRYLELLVAQAYAEIHETRAKPHRLDLRRWFFQTFPQTFRRHRRAFALALAITLLGSAFGGFAVGLDADAKAVILPFGHLLGDPAKRVAEEEKAANDRLAGHKATFSTVLMTHNTKVSVFTMALGMTWGLGTMLILFYNGVILGAVCADYVLAGQAKFLVGWLLPHGAVEIPSILIAGQAGLLLAGALIGRGRRTSLRSRLREIAPDLVTLIFGVGLLLVWAGVVEAFLSQYHEPILPYSVKIVFGLIELILLALFLGKSGAKAAAENVF